MDGQMIDDGWMMNECMDRWMDDGWTDDGWMDGWWMGDGWMMNGQMSEWMGG